MKQLRLERATTTRKRRQHQMHIWISLHEYERLKDEAAQRGETVSSVVKRLIVDHQARRARTTSREMFRVVSRTSHLHKK